MTLREIAQAMTPEQKAAFIVSQAACASAEIARLREALELAEKAMQRVVDTGAYVGAIPAGMIVAALDRAHRKLKGE